MFHAQMVSGNSFKTFSPLKLKTWTKHLCINKLKTSRHINTEWETSVDGSRSFRMSLKVDVPEENDQISIALHSSDLHCSFSLQSKGPFVPQPPGQHTSPPHKLAYSLCTFTKSSTAASQILLSIFRRQETELQSHIH